MTARPLARALHRPVLILDGAMGTELHRRGVDTGLPLWSAAAVVTHPQIVRRIHLEYIQSGAVKLDNAHSSRLNLRLWVTANASKYNCVASRAADRLIKTSAPQRPPTA